MPSAEKVLTLDRLLQLRQAAAQAGKTVVHCHGCFDIVHPGHIHHLEYARSLGDILVVSVSADTHVNKGVARPLIPDDLRAGSLAALQCVDWVHLNPHPTAVELLERLRPDVYVKGREYEQSLDPRFLAERDTVRRHGGRVVFSGGEIVYSSTALIQVLGGVDRFQSEKLARFLARYDLNARTLPALLQRARGRRVVVVGDYILDRYHFCEAAGVAGEAPMMALRAIDSRDFDGGAGVIALHLASLGAEPTLVTLLAPDPASAAARTRLEAAGVRVVPAGERREPVVKRRYLVDDAKLFKVDEGAPAPADAAVEEALAAAVLERARGADAVIFADFGYGAISAGLLHALLPALRPMTPFIAADVSGRQASLLRFSGVDLLCPTEREAREALQDFGSGLGNIAARLLHQTRSRHAILTLGRQGLVCCDWPDGESERPDGRLRSEYLPALAGHAVDPLGCGDALLAAATLAFAAGGSLQAAAYLGSLAAAVEAQALGNVPVTLDALLDAAARHAVPLRMAG